MGCSMFSVQDEVMEFTSLLIAFQCRFGVSMFNVLVANLDVPLQRKNHDFME